MLANIGAYVGSDRNLLSPFGMIGTVLGVYMIPKAYINVVGVLSNTNPTAPYRGAGRPEAIYLIERLIDDAARELGVDRVELRRKNMLPASALPYQSPVGPYYDCGEFEKNMDMALKLADVAGFAARKAESKKRGRLRGLGIVNAIEQAAGPAQPEYAEIRFNPSGTAALLMGTKNQGQGHETMFKQILNEKLGIDPNEVQYIDGDTDRVAFGMGTNGSRSTVLGGSALFVAADKVIEKGKLLAGHLLEAGEQDIEFADGNFKVKGTDKSVPLKEVAKAAFNPTKWPKGFEGGLYENATFKAEKDTYPNGCHICELEIDPETGDVTIDRYSVVDDVGTVMNPIGLKGQIHGGVAQGIGQILCEQVVWDRESGQLLTASFLDYAMPRAQMIPNMEVKSNPVPTKYNPLGAKGAGEAGTVGAMPVVMNAIMDALAPLGVKDVDDAGDAAQRVARHRGSEEVVMSLSPCRGEEEERQSQEGEKTMVGVKVAEFAFPRMEAPDLDAMEEFLTHFGLVRAERTPDALYMRGADGHHHLHAVKKGGTKFIGFAYHAASEDDLKRAARLPGASGIETLDEPGGGKRVRLTEPNGYQIEVIHGMKAVPPVKVARDRVNTGARARCAAPAG